MRIRRVLLPLCLAVGGIASVITAPAAGAWTVAPIPELAYVQIDPNAGATTGTLHFITKTMGSLNDTTLPVGVPVTPEVAMNGGEQIAFTALDPDGKPRVYVVQSDGSALTAVTPAGYDDPVWSPDGSKLAVVQADALTTDGGAVAVVDVTDADKLTTIPFANASRQQVNGAPAWSPDGSRLAFYAFAPPKTPPPSIPNGEVDIADADGTATAALNGTLSWPSGGDNRLVAWSPDGTRITFVAAVGGALPAALPTSGVYTVPADGSGGIAPPQPGPYSEFGSLAYSPDGSKLAYTVSTPAPSVLVTSVDGSAAMSPHTDGWSSDPQWVPGGKYLVMCVASTSADGALLSNLVVNDTTTNTTAELTTSGQACNSAVAPRTIRYAGATRVGTSISLSRQQKQATTVVIARSDLYPDALAAAPLAAKLGASLLLSPPSGLTPELKAEIGRLGATAADVIGNTAALSPRVETDLRAAGVATVNRVGGATRYETAAKIAELVGGTHAFVARGDDWPDAASVSQLAATLRQPILLTPKDTLDPSVTDTLSSLGITSVTIVGGEAAVTSSVENAIQDSGVTTSRLAGADRYATSVAVVGQLPGQADDHGVTLVSGRNWPDAIAAGASVTHPMVLVDPTTLANSPASLAWLTARSTNLVVAVGGPNAISPGDATEALTSPFGG